jgi:hypothetical protein
VTAEPHQLARDVRARHRNDFHRQREAAEDRYELGIVDDAHEAARGGGDDLLAGERRAAALDQMQLRVGFVGAVDVHVEVADGIQIQDLDAMLLEACSRALRTRNGTLDRHFARSQRIDEEVDGGAGADAENFVVGHVASAAAAADRFFESALM